MSVRKRRWVTRTGEQREAWVVDYVDQDGDRVLKHCAKKKEADAFAGTVRGEVDRGEHQAASKSETVKQAAERWIKRAEADGLERATVRQYRQHVNLHIGPRIGAIKLSDLTAKRVEAFRDDLLASMSRPLARKVMTSLKSVLKVAKRAHVAADVSIKRDKRAPKLEVGRDIPTVDEIKGLLAASAKEPIRVRALLAVAVFTGLRASELRGLRWQDISLERSHGQVRVHQRADRWNVIGAPKSASSVRKVDIDDRTVAVLKAWKIACPPSEGDLVFPTSAGAAEHHANMLRALAPVMKAARLVDKKGEPKYGLHSLRHYFASWCLGRHVDGGRELPLKVVQELMGHSSIAVTGDVYGHVLPSRNDRTELAAASAALWG